ncbi:MAG TPA: antibiotic biosynthesis monooxygenase family protein [Pyrinomonadaceae bacterium]|nr:antibiotic biosynthesis monooxygenase family protein [Pyrinomonadaceae bacterium]
MKPETSSEIISTAKFTVRPENRKEMCLTISSLVALIKNEEGCCAYRFYGEAGCQDSYLLMGEWETKEAWDRHLRSDNFAVLVGSLRLLGDRAKVDFKLLSHVAGIEAQTKARCDPYRESPTVVFLN